MLAFLTCADWPCRFPGCKKNRLRITDGVYNFCSREHKVVFGKI